VYDGAKLFYLSGMQHGKYLKREVSFARGFFGRSLRDECCVCICNNPMLEYSCAIK
jgi:hypothetical protein